MTKIAILLLVLLVGLSHGARIKREVPTADTAAEKKSASSEESSETAATIAPTAEPTRYQNYKKFIGETEYRLPFKTMVSEPFEIGQTIHTVGTLKEKPKRVDFNFHRGGAQDADMPLHFSIRFDEGIFSGKLVYNTWAAGNWSDNEQRVSNPFQPGEPFDLRVRILDGKYQLFANRRDIGYFEHQQDIKGIDHVSIRGDLTSLRLFHYGGRIFTLPYTAIANLTPGKRLDVSGVATGKRFDINLFREDQQYALQVSIRYNEKAIVRNSMEQHIWGKEEREGDFKLTQGEVIDVTIVNEEYSFQIFVNGQRYASFAHRGSATDIKTLRVEGHIDLQSITINTATGN